MTGVKTVILGIMLVLTISLFLILFSINFVSVTNPSSPIINSATYGLNGSVSGLQNQIDTFSSKVTTWENMLSNAQVNPVVYVFLFAGEMFYIPIEMFKFLVTGVASLASFIFNVGAKTTLGGSITIGLTLIVAGLGIVIVLSVIQFIRTGASER